jgi:Ribbon-helix-helix domain
MHDIDVNHHRRHAMTKSRVSAYLWLESFERLKSISEATGKPMIALMDEAIELLAQKYPRKEDEHGEVSKT